MADWEPDLHLELAGLVVFSETLVNDQVLATTGHITATGRLLVSTLTGLGMTKLKNWTALTPTTTEAALLTGPPALLNHSHQPDEEPPRRVVEADRLVGEGLVQADLVVPDGRLTLHVAAVVPGLVALQDGDQLDGVDGPRLDLLQTLAQVGEGAQLEVELFRGLVVD